MYNATEENPKLYFFHQNSLTFSVIQTVLEYFHFNPNTDISGSVLDWNLKILDILQLHPCSLSMGSWAFDWDFIRFLWPHPTVYWWLSLNIFLVCIFSLQSPTPAQSKYPGYTCRKKLALCFAPWAQWQTIKADCLTLFRQTVFKKAVTLDPALLMSPRTQIIFCGEI